MGPGEARRPGCGGCARDSSSNLDRIADAPALPLISSGERERHGQRRWGGEDGREDADQPGVVEGRACPCPRWAVQRHPPTPRTSARDGQGARTGARPEEGSGEPEGSKQRMTRQGPRALGLPAPLFPARLTLPGRDPEGRVEASHLPPLPDVPSCLRVTNGYG